MRRGRRLLFLAFVLSLLVHAIVAIIMHPPVATFENPAEKVSVVRRSTLIAARPTPPPPRPHQTPHPRNVSAPHKASPRGQNGPPSQGSGVAKTTQTPVPTPAPSVAASASACGGRTVGATLLATPAPPDIAPDARASATSGVAVVKVQLDAAAAVTNASVEQSTGNSSLDLVAVAMARGATYGPATHDCKPIAGEYAFSVKFVAW